MRLLDEHYIAGGWRQSSSPDRIDVVDSMTELAFASVAAGQDEDVDWAVAAARAAASGWSTTPVAERTARCGAVADHLEANAAAIADDICREVGMVRRLSEVIQVGLACGSFRAVAAVADEFPFEEKIGTSVVTHEPVGVVACITPWNYPLPQAAAKVAFALAAGCPVVLKPSEVAPLSAFALADAIDAAGFPPGVFNLVTGTGAGAGASLVAHADVDMVSFTGSTGTGKAIAAVCADRVARVALELGGKSAAVVLADADLPAAVTDTVRKGFLNSGQTCSALTRLVVPRPLLGEVEALAAAAAERLPVGDPFDSSSRLGPLASLAQWTRVQGFIERAVESGTRLIVGGPGKPDDLATGFYARATIFSDVDPDSELAQEEIFGPVLSIIAADDEDHAIDIANNSAYGLAGAVWSSSIDRAVGVARRMRTGQVQINDGAFEPLAPFGGFKQSGVGREYGPRGLAEFLETKALLH